MYIVWVKKNLDLLLSAIGYRFNIIYTCMGANDRIFDHSLFRSSVATTPVFVALSVPLTAWKKEEETTLVGLTVHSRPNRITRLVYQHTGIVIELDRAPILSLHLLPYANNDGMPHVTSTDLVCDTTAACAFGAEIPLLLDDHDDTVT